MRRVRVRLTLDHNLNHTIQYAERQIHISPELLIVFEAHTFEDHMHGLKLHSPLSSRLTDFGVAGCAKNESNKEICTLVWSKKHFLRFVRPCATDKFVHFYRLVSSLPCDSWERQTQSIIPTYPSYLFAYYIKEKGNDFQSLPSSRPDFSADDSNGTEDTVTKTMKINNTRTMWLPRNEP